MRAIEYRIMQKSQNLLNYGDISLIESRISTIFLLNTEFGTAHPGPLLCCSIGGMTLVYDNSLHNSLRAVAIQVVLNSRHM